MCGIFGFITVETYRGNNDRRKFIDNAAIAGTVRGDDGCGIFMVKHKMEAGESADWVKDPADGYSLVATKEYQSALGLQAKYEEYRAVIGHNRSATVGTIDLDNTHPFQEGPITLVHNGTLNSTFELGKSMHDLKSEGVEVDSHVICHNLAVAKTPDEVLSKLDGAFTLVWHDARDHSINIIRNDKRPLHMMPTACEDTILIASEAEMLYWLAKRNNFSMGPIVFPKPGNLLQFYPGEKTPRVRDVPLYVPRYHGGGSHWRSGDQSWPNSGRSSSRNSSGVPWKPVTANSVPKIPEPAEEVLAQWDLAPDMELRFVPSLIKQVAGRNTALVSGTTFIPGEEPVVGLITGLDYKAVEDALTKQESWAVRPVFVKSMEDKGDELSPCIILKLLSRSYVGYKRATEEKPPAKTGNPHGFISRMGDKTKDDWLPGPHGEYIPLFQWLRETADGCIQCGMPIIADTADDIAWVQGGARPLCTDCIEDNEGHNMSSGLN